MMKKKVNASKIENLSKPAGFRETVLPQGNAPKPIADRHFPDRVHAFVWRNWNVVAPGKIAKILGTSQENITALAESMGLPAAAAISNDMLTRGYFTIIRRNWHLLPYHQLLELLEMTPEQLAFHLREDDFMFHKLGDCKPNCEPLRYTAPDEAAHRRATEIKKVVEDDFGAEIRRPAEPRFDFLRQFNQKLPGLPAGEGKDAASSLAVQSGDEQVRFIYSYFAVYGDSLLDPALNPYPEGLLQQLAAMGVNGVWLHVVLRDMAPGGKSFPEFGAGHEQRLANLRAIVAQAKKYGIGVYLYINEPRPMPEEFFKNRPEMAGVRQRDVLAMCTSHPAVRQWISDALAHVFRQVPDLAGVFTITSMETLTGCTGRAGSVDWRKCPRCKDREYAEIVAEINAVIEEGVHRSSPTAKVLVWDWGWYGHKSKDARDVIRRLPKSVWLMSVSEWDVPICRGGIHSAISEYSLSAVGPGPRATDHWKVAKEAGLKIVAKVQLNNTWELSSLPYLPVMDLVAEHCHNLASVGVDGMMLSWSLGGYPSPNLEIAARFRGKPIPSIEEVLNAVAVAQYGAEGAPLARQAWTAFSAAFREYPYSCGLYGIPVQVGPANPLYPEKTGYHASMVGFPYDDLFNWRGLYPVEVFIAQFEKVAEKWRLGLPLLKAAAEKAPSVQRDKVQAELRFAEAAYTHFLSVANQARFVDARDALADSSRTMAPAERDRRREEIKRCLKSEIDLARQLFTLAQDDSRIGFEATNQHVYLPLDLVEKVINCRWLLQEK